MNQDYLDWKTFVNPSMPPDLRLRAEKAWLQRRIDGVVKCADVEIIKARMAVLDACGEDVYH